MCKRGVKDVEMRNISLSEFRIKYSVVRSEF